jgi:hypothetical protein
MYGGLSHRYSDARASKEGGYEGYTSAKGITEKD